MDFVNITVYEENRFETKQILDIKTYYLIFECISILRRQ